MGDEFLIDVKDLHSRALKKKREKTTVQYPACGPRRSTRL